MTSATTFEILPAIDLRGGRVVRLRQGDFERETAYELEPAAAAAAFAAAGARWLHVVDLDGARAGVPAHTDVIAAIVAAVGAGTKVEVAGGLRNEHSVAQALDSGAARIVIGTAALREPALAGRLVAAHGAGRVAVAIDVRDGRAQGHGWTTDVPGTGPAGTDDAGTDATGADVMGADAADVISRLADVGAMTFEVTAIERDGLLLGPNLGLYERLVRLGRGAIIASGGISTIDDLRSVREIGCSGAIVGRALYEGHLDLGDALRLAAESE